MTVMLVNPDLVRQILLKIESISYPLKGRIGSISVEGYDQHTVDDHVEELHKADVVSANIKRSRTKSGGPIIAAEVKHLTDTGWRVVGLVKKDDSWARVSKAIGGSQVSLAELIQILHREA